MKYIFLGIKGVLTTSSTEKKARIQNEKANSATNKDPLILFHKNAVEVLTNFLNENTPYKLILSSSWKNDNVMGLEKTNQLFSQYNLPQIEDVTPSVDNSEFYSRGTEILRWLEQNSIELNEDVIIIDSNVAYIRNVIPYRYIIDVSQGWVHTGIAQKHIDYWKRRNGVLL